jgi:hypothetical protein
MLKSNKEQCFWYISGKCARDEENTVAINTCKKKCEFFITWKNLLNSLNKKDDDAS